MTARKEIVRHCSAVLLLPDPEHTRRWLSCLVRWNSRRHHIAATASTSPSLTVHNKHSLILDYSSSDSSRLSDSLLDSDHRGCQAPRTLCPISPNASKLRLLIFQPDHPQHFHKLSPSSGLQLLNMDYLRRLTKQMWGHICLLAGRVTRWFPRRSQRKMKPKVFVIAMVSQSTGPIRHSFLLLLLGPQGSIPLDSTRQCYQV